MSSRDQGRGPKAIALGYDKASDDAPRKVARGQGEVAARILELAERNDVPIRREPDLLRLLEPIDLGEEIPIEAYHAVAEILAFLYRTSKR